MLPLRDHGYISINAFIDMVVVWVCLLELVMKYYDRKCLRSIRNRIGKMIKIDMTTKDKFKGKYA